MTVDSSVDLETPLLAAAAAAVPSSGDDHHHHDAAMEVTREDRHSGKNPMPALVFEMAMQILISIQVMIYFSNKNSDLSVWRVLLSIGVFMVTSIMYHLAVQSESPALQAHWLGRVFLSLPEYFVFLIVIVVVVQNNALMAYKALFIATILLASIGAMITMVLICQHVICDNDDNDEDDDDEVTAIRGKVRVEEALEFALVFDC
jgi:hypothetical protein